MRNVAESPVAKFYTKLAPMVTDPIYQLHMTILHQKKSKVCQPGPEIECVSKLSLTVELPVVMVSVDYAGFPPCYERHDSGNELSDPVCHLHMYKSFFD